MSHSHTHNNVTLSDGSSVDMGGDSTGAQALNKEVGENNKLKLELAFMEGMAAGGSGAGASGGASGASGGNYSDGVDDVFGGNNASSGSSGSGSKGNSLLDFVNNLEGTLGAVSTGLDKA